jgi:hypothetical protein
MKPSLDFLIVVLTLIPTAGIQAQTTNPPYLSQFPSVERVKSEIKGSDAMDTAARQMGAFWQLRQIIETLAGPRFYRSPTPDEKRLTGLYSNAHYTVSQPYASYPDKPKWYQMHAFYETDSEFGEELFKRFLSPALQEEYLKARGQAMARSQARADAQRAATNRANTTDANAAEGPVAVPQPTPAVPKATPSATRGSDPSIAKAKAANVDTKVFGIPLGEQLQLPACERTLFGPKSVTPSTCVRQRDWAENLVSQMQAEITGIKEDPNVVSIWLGQDSCPAWLDGCSVYGLLHDGLFVAVVMLTKGHNVDQAVAKELRLKYGPQTRIKPGEVIPSSANRRPFKVNDLEWSLPGLHVEYDVVLKGESEGHVENVERGRVRIEAEAAYQRRIAKEKAKP